ncbi:MAG TPA: AraD1 family protein [Opitutus sp.]|nr:AraD1 family protein [Opitutus sp.]
MIRLVQLRCENQRRVAIVEEPRLRLLENAQSVFGLAQEAVASGLALADLVARRATGEGLDYGPIHAGASPWRLLVPVDHPEPARCLVSGTGLTHLGSAKNRNAMHAAAENETDSMKMFRWGVERGKPAAGAAGIAPEWFYKGCGTNLRAHRETLDWPAHAEDGGEEGEIAGVYLIDAAGNPRRLGMAIGNEFSDHVFEKKNYLNLAGSKLRTSSLGPELVLDPAFDSVPGTVTIERAGQTLWSQPIASGEAEMCHSLANIEHHHFKFDAHRRPGDVHVHYFGACSLSFGAGIRLEDGDVMQIAFEGFGRPLRNPLLVERGPMPFVAAKPL